MSTSLKNPHRPPLKHSMNPVQAWLFRVLKDGKLPKFGPHEDWTNATVVFRQDFVKDYQAWAKSEGVKPFAGGRGNDGFLEEACKLLGLYFPDVYCRAKVPDDRPDLPTDRRGATDALHLPSLIEAREAFQSLLAKSITFERPIQTPNALNAKPFVREKKESNP